MASRTYTLENIYNSSNVQLDNYIISQGGDPQLMNFLEKRYAATVYIHNNNNQEISERIYVEHKDFENFYFMDNKFLLLYGNQLGLRLSYRIDMIKNIINNEMNSIEKTLLMEEEKSLSLSGSGQQTTAPPTIAADNWQTINSLGRLNGQKYQIAAKLGQGSFGTVESIIMNDGTMKARKTIYVKANQISIALAEINIWKRVSEYPNCNTNIVCYYDYMIQTAGPQFEVYIFMDYIRGENLNVVMNRYISQRLAMDTTTFKVINLQIASALSYMHQRGVAHRDIKASNIISGQNVKVIDMGLSCIIKQYAKECRRCAVCTNRSLGTAQHMGPELYDKNYKYPYNAFAADIWAWGILMYYMIYKRYPFNPKDKSQIGQVILKYDPFYIDRFKKYNNIISRCLNKNPAARSNANALYQLINALQ